MTDYYEVLGVSKDAKKAELFIDEFSHVYRYVLDTIEQSVSTLEKELDFMHSYFYLQEIRYGENLTHSINLPASLMTRFLPPLSLQIIVENAIKHNVVNELKPLHIDISYEADFLVVKNKIQSRMSKNKSTGIGLKNLERRYALISDTLPQFYVDKDMFEEERLHSEASRYYGDSAEELVGAILEAVHTFSENMPQADDITIMALAYHQTSERETE